MAKSFKVYRRVDQGEHGGEFVTKAFHDRNKDFCSEETVEVEEEKDIRVEQFTHLVYLLRTVPAEDTAEVVLAMDELAREMRAEILYGG